MTNLCKEKGLFVSCIIMSIRNHNWYQVESNVTTVPVDHVSL
jgi:hypothetical protein